MQAPRWINKTNRVTVGTSFREGLLAMKENNDSKIREGDYALLFYDDRRKWLIRIQARNAFHTHKGVVKLEEAVGKSFGEPLTSSLGHTFWLLRPTIYDFIMNLERPTQIMYPKDIGLMILKLGLTSGRIVIEAGTGSGALTMALANAVRPDGHVYSYEVRPEFIEVARRNVQRAGLGDYVTIIEADARQGFQQVEVDAVTIDLGEPWAIVRHAHASLKGGASLCSFSPTTNQVEKTVSALHNHGFVEIETVECLIRGMRVQEGKTRPMTRMIGHTGYITFARKIKMEP